MKTVLLSVFFIFCITGTAHSQLHFGLGPQIILDNTILGAQARVFFEHDNTWRGSGAFTYHLDNVFNWSIDFDAHYKLLDLGDSVNLAPIGGLAIIDGNGGTKIGVNIGAFLEIDIAERNGYIEPKFIFRDGTAIAVSTGIFF